MKGRRVTPSRSGVTFIELIVALTVFAVLIGTMLGFMSSQYRAFQGGVDRMSSLEAARFSTEALEADLRTAGTNTPAGQPVLGVLGTDVIAFMADYATTAANDPFAVSYDPEAAASEVSAPTSPVAIPNTPFQFPDTTYMSGGVVSPAELIVFYFSEDATTSRTDDYALYRRVNEGAPELISRNILTPTGNVPFFRYLHESATGLDSVPDSQLPQKHTVTIHGAKADTAATALVDRVRAVRVSLRSTNGLTGSQQRIVSLTQIIPLSNIENGVLESCGSAPVLGSELTATVGMTRSRNPAVTLTWTRATDEASGEQDVLRYAIWRRELPAAFGDPYLSIPAGQASYSYQDATIERGKTYQYALAAQDCTPSLSPATNSSTVTIPR